MNGVVEIRGASSTADALELATTHAKHAHLIASMPPELAARVTPATQS
jgi:predicted small metal-binding protein